MPSPNTHRDSFIRYLRSCYPYGEPWIDAWGYHPAVAVKDALRGLSTTDPILYRVVYLYTATHMSRHQICSRISYDYSTVKRKLDYAIDCTLNRLANRDINEGRTEELERN